MIPHPSIATTFEHVADLFPDEPAVLQGDLVVSYAALDDQAARLAGHLAAAGVRAGGRVAIGTRNRPEYLVAFLATLKLGASPVNVNFRYRAEELHHVLSDSGAQVVVFDDALAVPLSQLSGRTAPVALIQVDDISGPEGTVPFAEAVSGAPREREERRDGQWLLYTGGTTGAPRAVVRPESSALQSVLTQVFGILGVPVPADLEAMQQALVEQHDQRAVLLTASPLMHGTGVYGALTGMLSGGSVVLLPGRRPLGDEMAGEMSRVGVTDVHLVGDVFVRPLVEELERARAAGEPYDLSRLRRVQSVGTVWSAPLKRRLLDAAAVVLIDMVAATEGGPYAVSVSQRDTPDTQLSAFRLAPGARILDEHGGDVPAGSGQAGVLAARAPRGIHYAGAPEKTAATFREVDGQMYSAPGDLARLAADGTVEFLGRGSGVVNTGGEKVYTAEVEGALMTHPDVLGAVVVGVPDDRWGSAVAAVVELVPGATFDAAVLQAHVAATLASYKQPRRLIAVNHLERTASGKIDLRWATSQLSGQTPG